MDFVFRVDARLRPFGDAGPLAICFEAMEDYATPLVPGSATHDKGARVVAGKRRWGAVVGDAPKPFVYRRYLDLAPLSRSVK